MRFVFSALVKVSGAQVRWNGVDVRVRFAPSPTGHLHLGGLRTALYNYLLAKSQGGKFILRIEDTDRKRLVVDAAAALEQDLKWVGIDPDESPSVGGPYGPYVQSERTEIYSREAQKLLDNGSAYYCFCSERRLEILRKNAVKNGQVPKYDNYCRRLTPEQTNIKLNENRNKCVRFKLSEGNGFEDVVYGRIHYNVENVEGDTVIIKQDGLPTYHFASVVDDHYMKISHVVRGVEWLQSTDKHLMIYRALNFNPPTFAHLPLLLNMDGSKLSKRQGGITVDAIRSSGVEPRALLNFLSSVGGGFSKNKPNGNLSLDELTTYFDLKLVNSNSSKLPLDKLKEYNREELQHLIDDPSQICVLVENFKKSLLYKHGENKLELDGNYIKSVLRLLKYRINYIDNLLDKNLLFLWIKPSLHQLDRDSVNVLSNLVEVIRDVEFTKDNLSKILKEFCSRNEIPFKTVMMLLRKVLCGVKEGPGVPEVMELLGKETTVSRLGAALQYNLEES